MAKAKRKPDVTASDNFPSIKGLQVTMRATSALIPYGNNARTHSPEQVDILCKSLTEFGWTNPILVDGENGVVAGHGRLMAAIKLGIAEVPCIELAHLTPAQRRAYVIADNQTALRAGWDLATLRLELGALQGEGFNLEPLGFSLEELGALLAPAGTQGLTDPDDVPDVPEHPTSIPGDLWALGRHFLICGSATSPDDVKKVLRGVTPNLMVTDPPYGVDFDPTWRKGSEKRTYMGDKPDKEAVWREAWELFPGDVIYIWHASGRIKDLWPCLDELGFELRQLIIWNKMRFIIGRGDYCYNHDPCYYGVRKGTKSGWQGARDQPTVWDIKHRSSDTNHGAQKPVDCMKRPIENNSSPGQAVYEPFSGSGTTLIAAEMTSRACHAVELDPRYIDVTITRWQDFTGQKATLADDGRTFEEIGHERSRKAA